MEKLMFPENRISQTRALHHRDIKNAAPAKAILRISASVASDVTACFWFAFMHVPRKLWAAHSSIGRQKKIQVRTCTSRTSRTSSARELTGSSHQTYGEEGRALRPSAELYIVHSYVLWMCKQRSVA